LHDVNDSELDPEDAADYEALLKEQMSSKNTTSSTPLNTTQSSFVEATTNVTSLSNEIPEKEEIPDSEKDDTQAESFDKNNSTLAVKSSDNSSLDYDNVDERNSTESKHIQSIQLNENAAAPTVIKVDLESVTIDLEKSDQSSDFAYFSVESKNPRYPIKLDVKTNSPLNFGQCAISYKQPDGEHCIKSYLQIVRPNFVLKINKALLPDKLSVSFNLVISGCDSETRLSEIDFDGEKTPQIYHNSDHDCIYRIRKKFPTSMLSLKITNFPSKYERVCKAVVQIYNSKDANDLDGELQASFENIESVRAFQQGIFIGNQFALIKVVNCFENNEPIEIKIDLVKSK
jgi:hypothetical protein